MATGHVLHLHGVHPSCCALSSKLGLCCTVFSIAEAVLVFGCSTPGGLVERYQMGNTFVLLSLGIFCVKSGTDPCAAFL